MKNIFLTAIAIMIVSIPVNAHENWIDFQSNGSSTDVFISNGHKFPQSRMALSDRTINYCYVIGPSGKKIPLKTDISGKKRKGLLKTLKPGTYMVFAGLKNPPRYFLKAVITRGLENSNSTILKTGELFEIIPQKIPSSIKSGSYLPLLLLYKNKPLTGTISISINGRINYFGYTDSKGIYKLKIKNKGKYLLTASADGKTCSLVFQIP